MKNTMAKKKWLIDCVCTLACLNPCFFFGFITTFCTEIVVVERWSAKFSPKEEFNIEELLLAAQCEV